MHRIKALVVACAAATLALTAFGAPVAAVAPSTKMAIVNGDPFRKVDVCVNGKEIRSGLAYGAKVFKTTPTESAMVKFFKRSAKKCGGGLIGARRVYPGDAVVVLTRKTPQRVVVFNTAPVGGNTAFFYGNASDISNVEFAWDYSSVIWQTAADESRWVKGYSESYWDELLADDLNVDMVTVRDFTTSKPYAEKSVFVRAGQRREYIFLGTGKLTAKLVVITRKL